MEILESEVALDPSFPRGFESQRHCRRGGPAGQVDTLPYPIVPRVELYRVDSASDAGTAP